MYGSDISIQKKVLTFSNEYMPPGKVLHTWDSRTNFHTDRKVRELPFIEKGGSYEVFFDTIVIPEKSLYIKIDFFDKKNNMIDCFFSYENLFSFVMPEKCQNYCVSIINSGFKEFTFDNIRFTNKKGKLISHLQEKYFMTETYLSNGKYDEVNLIILEKNDRFSENINEIIRILNIKNVVFFGINKFDQSQEFIEEIRIFLTQKAYHDLKKMYNHINLIGYGVLADKLLKEVHEFREYDNIITPGKHNTYHNTMYLRNKLYKDLSFLA